MRRLFTLKPALPLQTCDLFWWRRRFRLRVAILLLAEDQASTSNGDPVKVRVAGPFVRAREQACHVDGNLACQAIFTGIEIG